jgi:hypothetical protein
VKSATLRRRWKRRDAAISSTAIPHIPYPTATTGS